MGEKRVHNEPIEDDEGYVRCPFCGDRTQEGGCEHLLCHYAVEDIGSGACRIEVEGCDPICRAIGGLCEEVCALAATAYDFSGDEPLSARPRAVAAATGTLPASVSALLDGTLEDFHDNGGGGEDEMYVAAWRASDYLQEILNSTDGASAHEVASGVGCSTIYRIIYAEDTQLCAAAVVAQILVDQAATKGLTSASL